MDYNKFDNQKGKPYVSPYRDLDNIPQHHQNNTPHNNTSISSNLNGKPEKRHIEYSEADKNISKVYLILALVLQFIPWLVTSVYFYIFYLPNYRNAYIWFPDDISFETFLIVVIIDCITYITSWIFMMIGRTKYPIGKLSKVVTTIFMVMLGVVIVVICRWMLSCIDECTRCPG